MGKSGKNGEMHPDLAHPHDLLVRNILADAELAVDFLQNYLPPDVTALLDWDSLQRESGDTVDPGLSKLDGDLRYSVRFKSNGKELRVFVFLEHQSKADRFMAFRMVGYIHAAYRQILPALKRGERFPYPLAVVLHHGKTPWKKIPPMRDLVDTVPGVVKDILDLPIYLVDLAAMTPDRLRGHPMICALLDSLQSASAGVLPDRMPGILGRLRGLGKEERLQPWVTALTKYYAVIRGKMRRNIDDLSRVFMELYAKKEAGEMAISMYEAIYKEGQARSVFTVLESRFGEIPAAIQKKLTNMRDGDRLEKALKLAATCQSLKAFQKGL